MQAVADRSSTTETIAAARYEDGYMDANNGVCAAVPWPGPATPWPGQETSPYPLLEQAHAPEESTPIPAAEYPVPAHIRTPGTPRHEAFHPSRELHTVPTALAPGRDPPLAKQGPPLPVRQCPYCQSWVTRFRAWVVCGTCRHCMV